MTDLATIRAREADPETFRQATLRADRIKERLEPEQPKLASLAHRAKTEANQGKKIVWLRKLAAPLVEAAQGLVPCHDGCAHCCRFPVLITAVEARVIAKETGAVLTHPDAFAPYNNPAYHDVDCPFLKDDRCSIYASRPFQCRIHYNVDRDSILCESTPDRATKVPFFNAKPWNHAFVDALLPNVQCADIRDFFAKD